jgi:transposase
VAQVQIITGVERRRTFSEEQKQAIVAEAFGTPRNVSAVARREDIRSNLIYRWRDQLRANDPGFAQVVLSSPVQAPVDRIEVSIEGRFVASIPNGVSPDLAAAIIRSLVRR